LEIDVFLFAHDSCVEIGLLKMIKDTDFMSIIDEDDCAYRDADLATAGKDISNEGNNGIVDIGVTLKRA
jgi:hypothetical protein